MSAVEKDALSKIICKNSLTLTPDEIAPVLGSTPQTIRDTAKMHPERIGYPFTFCGKNMRIPKNSFLKFLGIEGKKI